MIASDFNEFVEIWNTAQEMMSFGKQLSNAAMKMSFKLLSGYPFEHVAAAIYKHIETSDRAPQPSDIIKLLNAGNEHLSADEAWLIVPKSERDSAVWTDEMAEAWKECSDLYYSGDIFNATRGFKSAYQRICDRNKLTNRPIAWRLTRGTDNALLKTVVEDALRLGRLKPDYANRVLESLPKPITNEGQALIGGNVKVEKDAAWLEKLNAAKKIVADSLQADIEKHNAEKLAVENARRDNEDKAIALLPPEQQLALRSANLERYGNEVLH
jgi:hypothetical protein